ncbi:MAG: nucleotidyltransferase [Actinobacteria bacterium]|nr:nucleotidyltransferase [Actinomycetota bacterium]MBL7197280.1 nucleotidyltransferase [Candidatus Omnitrophota bacterium]
MSTYEKITKLSDILEQLAEGLDIPESKYLEAKKRYETVGEWLGKDDSILSIYKPEIYPQGSFCLGTVVKPISNRDEYDIDLVCYLSELKKQNTSQLALKKMVGDRLYENDTYKRLLDKEGSRCWTLNYANEFHMDILPAIPDEDISMRGGLYTDAVLITDKKKIENKDPEWPKSNPLGYAKWFKSRQEVVFATLRKQLAEVAKASVDEIPEYRVKTPLQRAIQILKRHRDIYFSTKNIDHKPISIIITTLSAILYNGQSDVYNAIYNIIIGLNENVVVKTGKFYIPNPVNPEENFADKWNEDASLPKAFIEWVNEARNTFVSNILEKADTERGQRLEESLGIKLSDNQSPKTSPVGPVYVKVNTTQERRPWGSECV